MVTAAKLALGGGLAAVLALASPAASGDPCSQAAGGLAPFAAESADGSWNELPPPARSWHSAVYDPVRDRLVIFGGNGTFDVWVLPLATGGPWLRLTPTGCPPPGRQAHAAVYDPVGDRILVFGGRAGTTELGDLWQLALGASPSWTRLEPAGTPPSARWGHTAVYDPPRERVIVFGGQSGSTYLNEVWALALAGTPTWRRLSPGGAAPVGRRNHSAVLDPARARMLVFGGFDEVGAHHDDVWALSLEGAPAWSAVAASGSPPRARLLHAAVFDPEGDRMVIYGGLSQFSSEEADAWELSFKGTPAWSQLMTGYPLPLGRRGLVAVFDPVRARLVMHGGESADDVLGDAWALSLAGTSPAWEPIEPSGAPFLGRSHLTAVYDSVGQRVVTYGGYDIRGDYYGYYGDTWTYPLSFAGEWAELFPAGLAPTARTEHSAVYDPQGQRMLVFGGQTAFGPYLDDVWELSLAGYPAWSKLTPAGTRPDGRFLHSAIYDPPRSRMLIFGGSLGHNDVWELAFSGGPVWNQLFPLGTPPAERGGHTAIYDPVRERMIVFGGWDGLEARNDTWALSLAGTPVWTEILPAGPLPPGRQRHAAVYDPVGDRMLVFGGVGDGVDDGVWSLSLGGSPTWTKLALAGSSPKGRSGAAAVYDAPRHRMVLVSGYDGAVRGDAWALDLAASSGSLVRLESAQARPDEVRVTWCLDTAPGFGATIYRDDGAGWTGLAQGVSDAARRVVCEDRGVVPGERYGYRLGVVVDGVEELGGEVWVDVPRVTGLALRGLAPNPAAQELTVAFTLASDAPARLELLDLSGRRVLDAAVPSPRPGDATLSLGSVSRVPIGLYLLRLSQGGKSVSTRACVLR